MQLLREYISLQKSVQVVASCYSQIPLLLTFTSRSSAIQQTAIYASVYNQTNMSSEAVEEGLADSGTQTQSKNASSVINAPDMSTHGHLPQSTLDQSVDCDESRTEDVVPADSAVGQFSLAPATQTTVVTTTTTTTTNFPPLLLRPPRQTQSLDPKLYPLAATPTPSSIKDIRFKVGGASVVFNEADDALSVLDEVSDNIFGFIVLSTIDTNQNEMQLKEQREALKASNGVVRSVATYEPRENAAYHRASPSKAPRHMSSAPALDIRRRRPVSPVSLPESSQMGTRRDSSKDTRVGSLPCRLPFMESSAARSRRKNVGLATPETENSSFNVGSGENHSRRTRSVGGVPHGRMISPGNMEESGLVLDKNKENKNPERSPLLERRTGMNSQQLASQSSTPQELNNDEVSNNPASVPQSTSLASHVSTLRRGAPRSSGTRLREWNSISAEDMCLPSPSLSPVTAMNTQHLDTSFDSAEDQGADTDSSVDNQQRQAKKSPCPQNVIGDGSIATENGSAPSSSLMNIPRVVDYFESIPDELKTYVMYQFLRRCPKPTLHFVADVVNPALKCDFLAHLPLELSLEVVKYFDFRTMCRASQVSKKWRHIINSDEKTWKELFDQDGYVLPEGELQRAIEEGWGWQYPDGFEDCEKDLRSSSASNSDSEFSSHSALSNAWNSGVQSQVSGAASGSRRLKRKASIRLPTRKLAKKKGVSSHGSSQLAPAAWMETLSAAESPYAAANAAALAVPYPDVGLPSLRSLHLYKSLYQRHHLIHKMWMRDDAKPMHIAFRAHDRHVVTCLQFDTDKILTGSDDSNINVYDTKTGALKSTLEGHEGGVWALEYYGNTLVSGSTDRSVRVWDIEAAECTQVFQGHVSTVRCLQILLPTEIGKLSDGTPDTMPKEPLIITGSRDANLRVWKLPQPGDPRYYPTGPPPADSDNPYFIRLLTGHHQSVRAIAAHGDTLVSGSYDCTVRVWKISTGEAVHRLQGHALKVYSVVLDHKRNRCISGSMDNLVKIWSLDTGSTLYTLEGHISLVGLLDLKEDKLVSAAADSTLRVWDPENGQLKRVLKAHTGAITCFQHDGQKVISGSDHTLKLWNARTGACLKDLLTDLSGVWQVKFNDRRCVAAVQRDRLTYIEVRFTPYRLYVIPSQDFFLFLPFYPSFANSRF